MHSEGATDTETTLSMILNEVNFLRELSACENIVELEEVHFHEDEKTEEKILSLVMRFAKYGSVLK